MNGTLLKFSRSSAKSREELNTFFAPEFVRKQKNSHLQRRQLRKFFPWALRSLILTCGSSRELIFDVSAARISANPALADETKMSSARYVPCNSDEFTVEISQS